MAHNCPDCGQICYCGGDIDDILWDDGSEEALNCTHWQECEADDEDTSTDDPEDDSF